MSSRVLKKLTQGEATPIQVDNEEEEELSEEETSPRNHLNPFDLLNQQSFSESEVKEDDNETEHASAASRPPGADNSSVTKKKKKKRKKKSRNNAISSEDNEKYLSDMDSLIVKVCEAKAEKSTPRIEIDKSLLSVELKHLNAQNELRRTFGKRVVKIENKRGRQKLTLKSTYMVTAKDTWPPITKNIINMKPVTSIEQGQSHIQTQFYVFEHSQYYQSVQNLFYSAIERTDSDFLISLIRRCPYHVDSLIQLSELCKMTEDFSLAAELIERAVLVLEMSLHSSFSLTSGNCRLDYRNQENRAFFIVLFKHAQYLEARACCRTAFELSKLILGLSPDVDPLAMVLIIDYYALRSKQYAWLIKFYEEYDALRNLSQLPNMAYSYALSLFCVLGESEKADKALQYALLMFPGVLRPLLEELSVQTDKRVLASSYFHTEISGSQSPALHQLVCLYICRAKVVWRQNNILGWMERNVNSVLDRIDAKDEIISDYNQKRAARYVTPPRAILRHVILSDYKEKVPLAPFVSKEKDAIVMYDPLPPSDTVNAYERKSTSSSPTAPNGAFLSTFFQSIMPNFNLNNAGGEHQNAANGAVAAAAAPDDVEQQLQALNANLENAAAEGAAAGADGARTSYRELTQSLTNVVDAMRDFLQNLGISEQQQVGDAGAAGSSEEDTSDYYD